MRVHPTAIVSKDAEIEEDVEIGPYTVIGPFVKIGRGTWIDCFVRIEGPTEIGEGCQIFQGVAIGLPPQDFSYKGEKSSVIIGKNNTIREFATIHRATGEGKTTSLGDGNFIMAYVHLAHNVKVGSEVIIANGTQLAGYVEVMDKAYLSGLVAVHQYVRIGELTIVGGLSRVTQDIPPYMMAVGNPAKIRGLNLIGLRRHGFTYQRISILKEAYKILYRSGLNTSDALEQIEEKLPLNEDIRLLLRFIRSSSRGILKKTAPQNE